MARSCPHCGAKVPEVGDAFCFECHNALDEAPAGSPPPALPESQGPTGTGEHGVWYATEGRVLGWAKFAWDDDRGVIDPAAGGLRFAGRSRTLHMPRLRAAPLLVWVVPWAAIASLALGNALFLLLSGAGVFNYLTLDSPVTYVALGLMDLFALVCWPMQWIRVDFVDEQGEPGRAYFTMGSAVGRWAGGVRRLRDRLEQWMQPG